jgi:hypothetical protein
MRDVSYYLSKVPPLHSNKPLFNAELALLLQPLIDAATLVSQLPTYYFDIDTAVGVQLDAVGARVGRTRAVPLPLQNVFFAFDDPLRGADQSIWYDEDINPGVTYSFMDDDAFRRVLKAVAISNEWDGSVPVAKTVIDTFMLPGTGTFTFVEDKGFAVASGTALEMQMVVGISGVIPNIVDVEVLSQDILGIKPATVTVTYLVTSVNGEPIFGLDVDNDYVGGLDHAAWGVDASTLAASDAALLALSELG